MPARVDPRTMLTCRISAPEGQKIPNLAIFSTLSFHGGSAQRCTDKDELWCMVKILHSNKNDHPQLSRFNRIIVQIRDEYMTAKIIKTRLVGCLNKNRPYWGQGLWWRLSSARLRIVNDTVTSRPRCFFVQRRSKMGKDRGGSFKLLLYYTSAYNKVETNQPPQDLFTSSM